MRKEIARNQLFTEEDVIEGSRRSNYDGEILVVNAGHLNDWARTPANQLYYASGGFGTDPTKMGTAVFCFSVADGEHCRWERGNFLGILKPELVKSLGIVPRPYKDWVIPLVQLVRHAGEGKNIAELSAASFSWGEYDFEAHEIHDIARANPTIFTYDEHTQDVGLLVDMVDEEVIGCEICGHTYCEGDVNIIDYDDDTCIHCEKKR